MLLAGSGTTLRLSISAKPVALGEEAPDCSNSQALDRARI